MKYESNNHITIETTDIQSTTIVRAIREVMNKFGLYYDMAEDAAIHIVMLGKDWRSYILPDGEMGAINSKINKRMML